MSENRTKKAFVNVAFNFANQIVTLVLSFISRTVFIYAFGVEYLGINGLFTDVLGLLSMADLGFNTVMVYSLYQPLAEKDTDKIASLVFFYRKVYIFIAIVVSVVGVAFIPFLPFVVNLEKELKDLNIYYLLSLANVVFSYLWFYKTSILTADQKNYVIVKISMLMNVLKIIAQIFVIMILRNYIVYLAIGTGFVLINNIVASKVAVKHYPFIKQGKSLEKREQKEIMKNIGSGFLYKVSSVLLNSTDNILISVMVGTVAVGLYSNYLMLQTKISCFYILVFSSITASIGNLIAKENERKRYEIFQCEQVGSYIICGVLIPCYISLVNDFIVLWLGEKFVLSDLTVWMIGLNMYLGCVLQPLWSYRDATGLFRKTKWIMVICAIFNIVLSVMFGVLMDLPGILLASSISRLLTYVWYEPKVLFKEYFNLRPYKYYFSLVGNFVLILGLSYIGFRLGRGLVVESVGGWLLKAIIIGSVSVLITSMVYKNSNGTQLIKEKIVNMFKRDEDNRN